MSHSSDHAHPPFYTPLAVSVLFILTILVWSNMEEYETEHHKNSSPKQEETTPKEKAEPVPGKETEVSKQEDSPKTQVVGFWEDNHHGKRYLTINSDGSGQMICRLEGIAALMVGKKFHLNIQWDIVDGYAVFETIGGEPDSSVAAVNSLWGAKQKQKILELSKDNVQLLDMDGETVYNWKRIEKIPEEVQLKPQTSTT